MQKYLEMSTSSGRNSSAKKWLPMLQSTPDARSIVTAARVNPRPAGVWIVTRPAGGGGPKGPPWDLPNYWSDFQISNAIR